MKKQEPDAEKEIVVDAKPKITVPELPVEIVKKQRKNQIVGMDQIKLISMILHHQKKIGLKLTGDKIHEKNVDYNNRPYVQHMKVQGNFYIDP